MPFLLTRTNLQDISADAKVIGSCPYSSQSRNRQWHPDLWAEQRRIEQLPVGQSMMTSGQEFNSKYGIVTTPPLWSGGSRREELHLAACYDSSLRLAHRRRCKSIAFPLLSGDCHGFPRDLALKTAISTIREFLSKHEMTVYLSIRDSWAVQLPKPQMEGISHLLEEKQEPLLCCPQEAMAPRAVSEESLKQLVDSPGETFSQSLLRLIDEKGLKDPEVYQKANLDRRLFSKIRSNPNYQPSRTTALALALALELDLAKTERLIGKAGFALSDGSRFDIIVRYYIEQGNFDIYEINQALFAFEQPLIGS